MADVSGTKTEAAEDSRNDRDAEITDSGDDRDDRQTVVMKSSDANLYDDPDSPTESSNANKSSIPFQPQLPPMGDSLQLKSCESASSLDSISQNESQRSSTSQSKENVFSTSDSDNRSLQSFQKGETSSSSTKSQDEVSPLKSETILPIGENSMLKSEMDNRRNCIHLNEESTEMYDRSVHILRKSQDGTNHPNDITRIGKDLTITERQFSDKSLEENNQDDGCLLVDDYGTESDRSYDEKIYHFRDYELSSLIESHLEKDILNENPYVLPEQHLLFQRKEFPHLISEDTTDEITGDICTEVSTSCLEGRSSLPLKHCDYSPCQQSYENFQSETSVTSQKPCDKINSRIIPSFGDTNDHFMNRGEEQTDETFQELSLKEHLSRISQEIQKAEQMGNVVIQKLKTNFQDITDGITTMTEDLADAISDLVKEVNSNVSSLDENLPQQTHVMFDQLWRSISQEVDQLKQLSDHITTNLDPNFGETSKEF